MQKFAVFDIDGTLFRFALFHSIVERMAAQSLFHKEKIDKLTQGRQQWKARAHSDAFWDYVKHSVEAYESSLPHINTKDYLNAVNEVFETEKDHVYTYTRDLINQLKTAGYFLIAISGSQSDIVDKFATYYGFDDWVGTVYEQKNGKFTGKIISAHSKKHVIVKALINKHSLNTTDSIGVGDTDRDISMLEFVEKPIAFNPNRQLFEYAQKRQWPIVIERKNVVYKLTPQHGTYILA